MYESGGGMKREGEEVERKALLWPLIISRGGISHFENNASFSGRSGKNGHNTICSLK